MLQFFYTVIRLYSCLVSDKVTLDLTSFICLFPNSCIFACHWDDWLKLACIEFGNCLTVEGWAVSPEAEMSRSPGHLFLPDRYRRIYGAATKSDWTRKNQEIGDEERLLGLRLWAAAWQRRWYGTHDSAGFSPSVSTSLVTRTVLNNTAFVLLTPMGVSGSSHPWFRN